MSFGDNMLKQTTHKPGACFLVVTTSCTYFIDKDKCEELIDTEKQTMLPIAVIPSFRQNWIFATIDKENQSCKIEQVTFYKKNMAPVVDVRTIYEAQSGKILAISTDPEQEG